MRRLLVALAAMAILASACSDDSDPPAGLPPVDVLDSADLFEPELTALGLRLTDRGGLIDRSDGGYEKSAQGDHFALYVEPIDDAGYTLDDFATNLVELTRLTAPRVFDAYPGVVSYDICQEPTPALDTDPDADEPRPLTQVQLTRDRVEAIDWETFDTAALFAESTGDGNFVFVSGPIAEHPDIAPFARG